MYFLLFWKLQSLILANFFGEWLSLYFFLTNFQSYFHFHRLLFEQIVAEQHQVNTTIATTKDISVNIVCKAVSMKRYWKTIWKDVSYTGHRESSFHKLKTKIGVTKSSLENGIPTTFNFRHLRGFRKCFT